MQVVYVDEAGQQETAYLQCKVGWDRDGAVTHQDAVSPHCVTMLCTAAVRQ